MNAPARKRKRLRDVKPPAKLAKPDYSHPRFNHLQEIVRGAIRRWAQFPAFLYEGDWYHNFVDECLSRCFQFIDLPEDEMTSAVIKQTRHQIGQTKTTYTITRPDGTKGRRAKMREEHPSPERDEDGLRTGKFKSPIQEAPCGLYGNRIESSDWDAVQNDQIHQTDTLTKIFAVQQVLGEDDFTWLLAYTDNLGDGASGADYKRASRLRKKVREVLGRWVEIK